LRANLGFEELVGLIQTPFMRADGTISGFKSGYDDQTGLWIDLAGVKYRPVLDRDCTKANALAALQRLKQVLSEYRFADPLSGTVALAAMLTPLMRPAVLFVPIFAIDAPIQGSGKTKLAVSIAALMTGLAPALVQGTSDTKELDKRINGVLLGGDQCVVIDNIVGGGWGTADLCATITTERVAIRPLGTSKIVRLKNTFILFVIGNNLVIEGDVVRRTLPIRIDPNVARPDREQHSFDPVDYVREHRVDMVYDILLILRAYVLANRPPMGGLEIGSFSAWAQFVRDPLMWLGEPDVVGAIDLTSGNLST
jgi:putative DNA primase/helicase